MNISRLFRRLALSGNSIGLFNIRSLSSKNLTIIPENEKLTFKKKPTEKQLKETLTELQYYVTQEKGTERAFSGDHLTEKEPGIFGCIVCDQQIFSSDTKFKSGTGWPSFYDVINSDRVHLIKDTSYEPPAELSQMKQDLIGDTMFSKHWLCEFLLKLIKKIDDTDEFKNETEISYSSAQSTFKELECDFEKDLCDLWDMSVEKDVCVALDEFNSLKIFEGYIRRFDQVYPRAVEILIGIMVNMATLCDFIALKLVGNKSFIQYLLFEIFSSMSDVPTTIQSVKLFTLFLKSDYETENESKIRKTIKKSFVEYLKNELDGDENEIKDVDAAYSQNWQGIIEKFYFILEQSLNPGLLDCSVLLLLNLLDSDDQILESLTLNQRIVDAICNSTITRVKLDTMQKTAIGIFTESRREASTSNLPEQTPHLLSQISEEDIFHIDHIYNKYFLCLQTISTCETGVNSLVTKFNSIIEVLSEYLEKCLCTFNDWEIRSANSIKTNISNESLQNLICIISLMNCVLINQETSFPSQIAHIFPTFLLNLFTFSKYYLELFYELSKNNSESSYDLENFEMVKYNFKELFQNLYHLQGSSDQKLKKLLTNCIDLLKSLE